MTVRELVEWLQSLPQEVQDFPIIYSYCSDYTPLETKNVRVQRSTDKLYQGSAVPHHNMPGEYRAFSPYEYECRESEYPTPANVVIFPGN